MAADLAALRNYVTADDANAYTRLPKEGIQLTRDPLTASQGMVSVTVTHSNLSATLLELKFELHSKISDVKTKIYTHVGTSPQHQSLVLRSAGKDICRLDDTSKKLGFYGVESGMEIHVIDNDPFSLSRGGGLEDVSLVQKYRMTEEDYDKRNGTLRSWVKEQKAKDPSWVEPWKESDAGAPAPASEAPPGPESTAGMEVGMRCQVQPGARRGTIMHVGEVEGLGEGQWLGVKFDEPSGRGDGTVKGRTIFECGPRYGGFVRPRNIEVGDFPELDLLDEDEDEDEI